MAYYDALIAAWNSATQPPTGYSGTPITGGMTTAQKLAAVNSWTQTGSVPTSFNVTGAQLLNCINWTEFAALTAAQQSNLLALCANPGPLLGGSSNVSLITDGMFLAYFTNHSGATITALTALAKGVAVPWSQVNGYSTPISNSDVTNAGLS